MMITRCPNCTTSFRVTPDQLKAMQGRVRCGQCQQVFNAIDSLLDETAEPAPLTASQPDLLDSEPTRGEHFIGEGAPMPEILNEQAAFPEPYIEPENDQAWRGQPIEPELHETLEKAAPRRTWAWLLASSLALMVLLLQAIVHFRIELSLLAPGAKPFLQALCKPLDCNVPLPSKSDLISIEASDLRPEPQDKAQFLLTATLKNRAPFTQTFPHLELTLTDTVDRPILRKVLAPADYLPKAYNLASGFAKNVELPVNLMLFHDPSANVQPSGYRLYLFYP